jgi:hypothetical protein
MAKARSKAASKKTPASKKKPAPKKATSKRVKLTPELEALASSFSDPDDYDLEAFDELELGDTEIIDRRESGLVKLDMQTVVTGDFVIDGDLELNGHLLVLGSLRCTGFMFTGIHSCLVVRGDVTARAVEAWQSYWLINGSITTETAWLSNEGFLMLGGELHARLLVVEMYFDLVNDPVVTAKTRIDTEYLREDEKAQQQLRAVLDTSKLRDPNWEFDSWALLRAMSRGDTVFRLAT